MYHGCVALVAWKVTAIMLGRVIPGVHISCKTKYMILCKPVAKWCVKQQSNFALGEYNRKTPGQVYSYCYSPRAIPCFCSDHWIIVRRTLFGVRRASCAFFFFLSLSFSLSPPFSSDSLSFSLATLALLRHVFSRERHKARVLF